MEKRFVINGDFIQYIDAAKKYVEKLSMDEYEYLFQKPYSKDPRFITYFNSVYNALNLIQAMDIKLGGTILEVGSGPGWLTEILVGLGYHVDCVEPSAYMIEIAQYRMKYHGLKHHLTPVVSWTCSSIEEWKAPENKYDAVIFFDALHHICNENLVLEKIFNTLIPGGILGICEGAWVPGNKQMEESLTKSMNDFSALESPFTRKYLDDLLLKIGFININRYYAVNGLFLPHDNPIPQAQKQMKFSNTLITFRPYEKSSADPTANTAGNIEIIAKRKEAGKLFITVNLINTGETIWLQRPISRGYVTVAMRKGIPGSDNFHELRRHLLPRDISPGECLEIELEYPDSDSTGLTPDLVNEGFFWFSQTNR